MNILEVIAEEKIKEAMKNGQFDDVSCKGKPLQDLMDDLSGIPAELRASYTILKNAGVLPEEIQLQREIVRMEDLLESGYDDKV